MKNPSNTHRLGRLAMAAVAAVTLGVMAQPMDAAAQPTRGSRKADKPRAESPEVQNTGLTDEQRARVQEIVREHREASRNALREKLSEVMTPEQLKAFDQRRDGQRGTFGMRGDRRSHHDRRDFRRADRWDRTGDCRCCGGYARGGGRKADGPRPRMGEFRGERAEGMVERLAVALDLTEEQHEKIAGIVREHHEQFKDFDPSTLSFEERQKTREAHQLLLSNRIKEALTPEQAEKFDALRVTMPGPRRGGRGPRGLRG
jgi:Spy/CpxP family protein refolding chaperone